MASGTFLLDFWAFQSSALRACQALEAAGSNSLEDFKQDLQEIDVCMFLIPNYANGNANSYCMQSIAQGG